MSAPNSGKSDRIQGIAATFVALFLVIVAMVVYYRFAGLVASIAVLFNLLIIWATLQNLGATLTLAGLAGVILTVGMAVDANVLVFERIKEEFAITGRIGSAISAGYKKAYQRHHRLQCHYHHRRAHPSEFRCRPHQKSLPSP